MGMLDITEKAKERKDMLKSIAKYVIPLIVLVIGIFLYLFVFKNDFQLKYKSAFHPTGCVWIIIFLQYSMMVIIML